MACPSSIECLQVQYLVAFIVGLVGDLVKLISGAMVEFGDHLINASQDGNTMAGLTTGIFGTNSGLIYWINDKIFYLIENMPWCELGSGLGALMYGLQNPQTC